MRKIITLITLFLLFTLTSCGDRIETNGIILETSDNVQLAATYEVPEDAKRAVILLHMLGGDKTQYASMVNFLHHNGVTVLAPDFRGHGESELNYQEFSEEDWQNLVLDVEAAVDFLEDEGYTRIAIIGASIGANAGFKHAMDDLRVDMLILLSAAEEYKGINVIEDAENFARPTYFMASYADKEAAISATRLFNAVYTGEKDVKLVNTGHGTEMINAETATQMAYWLKYSY